MTELRKLLDDLVEIALLAYQEDTDYYWELLDDAKYRIEQWVVKDRADRGQG